MIRGKKNHILSPTAVFPKVLLLLVGMVMGEEVPVVK